MRKLATIGATAALACSVLLAPGVDAAPRQVLTVVGTGTVSVDWTVRTATRLDFDAATLTTKGDVVGFAVEDLRVHEVLGLAADAPRLQYDVSSPVSGPVAGSRLGAENTVDYLDLKPGRYRLRLVSHGASRVVVPVTKGRGATLTARAPSAGLALLVDPRVAGSSASRWERAFTFRGKAMGLLATNEHTWVYGVSAIDQCVQLLTESSKAACRLDPAIASTAAFGGAAFGDGYCRSSLYFNPAWMPSGTYRAEVTSTTVGVDKDVLTMLVVVEPTR